MEDNIVEQPPIPIIVKPAEQPHPVVWTTNPATFSPRPLSNSFTTTRTSKPKINYIEEKKDKDQSKQETNNKEQQNVVEQPNILPVPEIKKERSSSLLAKFEKKASPRKKDKEGNLKEEMNEINLNSTNNEKKRSGIESIFISPRGKKEKEEKEPKEKGANNNNNNNNVDGIPENEKQNSGENVVKLLSNSGSPQELKEESKRLFELASASVSPTDGIISTFFIHFFIMINNLIIKEFIHFYFYFISFFLNFSCCFILVKRRVEKTF